MKISGQNLLIILVVGTLFQNCALYYPQTTDIPLISEKGETKVDAGVSLVYPTLNATVSYGLSNHVAMQVQGAFLPTTSNFNSQAALGYYNVGEKNMVQEVYCGVGFGDAVLFNYNNDNKEEEMKGNYSMLFAQYNIGKAGLKDGTFDFGFGLKAGYVYSNITDYKVDTDVTLNDKNLLLEPAVFVRMGGEQLKLQFKAGACLMKTLGHENYGFPYYPLNAGISLNYKFNSKK